MPMGVRLDADVTGLAEVLAARGIAIEASGPALLTTRPGGWGWSGPVIVLVPAGEDIAAVLDAGAADAVPADATPAEVAARIAARLRTSVPPLTIGELLIDRIARRVTRAGQALALLPREYALLLHLADHAGAPVSRAALLEAIWGMRFDPGTNVVQVHVSRLRAKLDHGFAHPMLRTEKGIGYRLAPA